MKSKLGYQLQKRSIMKKILLIIVNIVIQNAFWRLLFAPVYRISKKLGMQRLTMPSSSKEATCYPCSVCFLSIRKKCAGGYFPFLKK